MFNIGDRVRIIEPKLDIDGRTNGLHFITDRMEGFIGHECIIRSQSKRDSSRYFLTSIDHNNPLRFNGSYIDEWVWHESWLEKVEVYDELDDEPDLIELLFNEM